MGNSDRAAVFRDKKQYQGTSDTALSFQLAQIEKIDWKTP